MVKKDDHGKALTVFISSKTISTSDLHPILITCELILNKILFDTSHKTYCMFAIVFLNQIASTYAKTAEIHKDYAAIMHMLNVSIYQSKRRISFEKVQWQE